MEKSKIKIKLTLEKINNGWKVKNRLLCSLPVVVFHNCRRKQAEALEKLKSELKHKEKLEKSEPSQRKRIPITRANRRKTAEEIQNSFVNNPNIAIGIVSLLQPGAIASILRENNVEIPMSSLNNTNDSVPNANKDINNNNRSDASTCTREPPLNTRDDNKDKDDFVDKISKFNQTTTIQKEQGNVENTKGKKVSVLNMETQTDALTDVIDLIEVEEAGQISIDEPVSDEQVQLEAPAVTINNLPSNFISQEAMHQLCQLSDWNKFILQTEMGRTQQDWFDPNAGKGNVVQKSGQRKRKSTAIVEYDPDLFLTRHMMPKNPTRMSDFAEPALPMSYCDVSAVPSTSMDPRYNTHSRSTLRLDPAYQYDQNVQYMPQQHSVPQQPINVVPPMMYQTYPPRRHHHHPTPKPPPPPPPYRPMHSSRGQTRSRWQVPVETQTSMNQYLHMHHHLNEAAMRAHMARAMQMPHQTFIDDPRRRTRK